MVKVPESRRAARELAFQVLYGLIYVPAGQDRNLTRIFADSPDPAADSNPTGLHKGTGEPRPEGFAWELVRGVCERLSELDEIVIRFSQHWRIERIAKIELTILRLSLYEMLYRSDVPVKVAINEAIELAKKFGDDNSRGFVNGILDAAAKAVENGEIGVH